MSPHALFRRDAPLSGSLHVIRWWEVRRIPYNLVVGAAGLLTCLVVFLMALASEILFHREFGLPKPPVFAIVGIALYGVGANLCYTSGWMSELIVRLLWPAHSEKFGMISFKFGMIFSIFLTLSPVFLIAGLGSFRLISHHTRSAAH